MKKIAVAIGILFGLSVLFVLDCATTPELPPAEAVEAPAATPAVAVTPIEAAGRKNTPAHAVWGVDPRVDMKQEQILVCGWDPARNAGYCIDFERFMLRWQAEQSQQPDQQK